MCASIAVKSESGQTKSGSRIAQSRLEIVEYGVAMVGVFGRHGAQLSPIAGRLSSFWSLVRAI
jgi:hypothetical protein